MIDKLEELQFNVAWAMEHAKRAEHFAKLADEIIDELMLNAAQLPLETEKSIQDGVFCPNHPDTEAGLI